MNNKKLYLLMIQYDKTGEWEVAFSNPSKKNVEKEYKILDTQFDNFEIMETTEASNEKDVENFNIAKRKKFAFYWKDRKLSESDSLLELQNEAEAYIVNKYKLPKYKIYRFEWELVLLDSENRERLMKLKNFDAMIVYTEA